MDEGNPNNEIYHCTECGVEVKFEDKICPKCGADLSVVVDEDEDINIITVQTFANDFEAEIAKKKLKLNGIESFVSGDNVGGLRPQLSYTQGVRLKINEKNIDKAIKILDEKQTEENYFGTKCSFCGADVTLNKKEFDSGEFICPGCNKKNHLKK